MSEDFKVKKKRILVEKFIYDCGKKGHNHLTYEVASKCAQKKPVKKRPAPRTWKTQGDMAIAYYKGETYKSIGERHGLSGNRVSQIIYKIGRLIGQPHFDWEAERGDGNPNIPLIKDWVKRAPRRRGSTKKAREKQSIRRKRQDEVYRLYGMGHSKTYIAKTLGISDSTVKSDLRHGESLQFFEALRKRARKLDMAIKGEQVSRAWRAIDRQMRLGISLHDAALMSGISAGDSGEEFPLYRREVMEQRGLSGKITNADLLDDNSGFEIGRVRFAFLPDSIGQALNKHYGPPEKFGDGIEGERALVRHALDDLKTVPAADSPPVPGLSADGLLWLRVQFR